MAIHRRRSITARRTVVADSWCLGRMRTFRALILMSATLSIAGASVGAIESCGGRITVGYDDAGNFHTGDGSVLIYGSACVGWDASPYANGNFDRSTTCDLNTDECTTWFVPPGWVQSEKCYQSVLVDDAGVEVRDDAGYVILIDSGSCGVTGVLALPTCDRNDPASDAFCSAWFDQFVAHGHVHGTCPFSPGPCSAVEELPGCDTPTVYEQDGSQTCFSPCRP